MKKGSVVFVFFIVLSAFSSYAQDVVQMSHKEFLEYTKQLFKDGNDCYVSTGNKAVLRGIIDTYQHAIEQRRKAGLITIQTADSLMFQVNKLEGDYHYLDSDETEDSYQKAEKYFKLCLDFANDTSHRQYQNINHDKFILYQERAQLYYKQQRYHDAFKEMKEAESMASKYLNPYSDTILDLYSQLAICQARVASNDTDFDQAIETIDLVIDRYNDTLSEPYGEALRKKAKILMLKQESRDAGMNAPAEEALEYYKEYFTLKKTDALQRFEKMNNEDREAYWMRIRPFVVDCYRLEEVAPAFLYDVTLFSKGLMLELNKEGGGKQNLGATWCDVQKQLKKDECAIEFVQYEKYGQQKMAALVLKNKGEPVFVEMASPDSVMKYKIGAYSVEERLTYVKLEGEKYKYLNRIYQDSMFFKYIWNPQLLDAIGKNNHVWFAPDGYMHRIAIEYQLPQEASRLQCHRLTSTRTLLRRDNTKAKKLRGNALIIGGINYNKPVTFVGSMQNDSVAYFNFRTDKPSFDSLKGSMPEVQSIYHDRNNANDQILTGEDASEHAFRALSSSYPIIFVSSHGLFKSAAIPIGTDLKPCLSDQSLSESIIAFSGINSNIQNAEFVPTHLDGILSAKELSSLDLTQVELIVLSCCESGLGNITSDGVYGIQRGLKNAGSQAIVVSLWDVKDDASQKFMICFFQQLNRGRSIYDSFQEARKNMKDEMPIQRDVFVLIDAI